MIKNLPQSEMSIEDRLEAAFTACQFPVEEIYQELKEAIRDYLESKGFMVDLVKREGTPTEKVLEYFFLDRMLSYEQVRNGIIRNQSEATKYIYNNKSQVRIDMELAEMYSVSYTTLSKIRWRDR